MPQSDYSSIRVEIARARKRYIYIIYIYIKGEKNYKNLFATLNFMYFTIFKQMSNYYKHSYIKYNSFLLTYQGIEVNALFYNCVKKNSLACRQLDINSDLLLTNSSGQGELIISSFS